MGEVYIGTSGYSFKDWVGPYYPEGTKSGDMLEAYALDFGAVEVNYTYYRMPSEKTSAGMVRKTPDGFQFFVKAHKSATHQGDLAGSADFLAALSPMRSEGKLAGILFQFPQSFKNTEENRKYLRAVTEEFGGDLPLAVEFRDNSWDQKPLYEYLEKLKLNFVAVDEPKVSTLFPRVVRATGDVGYLRFHSRNGAKWYRGGAARYDYLYSDDELREWLPGLREMAMRARNLFIYFNNCHAAQAVQNARKMKELLAQTKLW